MSETMGFKKKTKPDAEDSPVVDPQGAEADDSATEREEPLDPLEQLTRERDEFESKYLRALADFQNFQRRASLNERVALESGTANVVKRLLRVLEQLDMALAIDPAQADVNSMLEGVAMIRGEFVRALQEHGVVAIEPVAGDEMVAEHHEAVGYIPSDEHPEGSVAQPVSTGYRIGDRVLQPARVMLAAPMVEDENVASEGEEPPSTEDAS
jgi:molecular chaperone GrpE